MNTFYEVLNTILTTILTYKLKLWGVFNIVYYPQMISFWLTFQICLQSYRGFKVRWLYLPNENCNTP